MSTIYEATLADGSTIRVTKEITSRKITYNNGTEIILSTTPYPYLSNPARETVVLRFDTSEENATFEQLHDLQNNAGDILYYEQSRLANAETGEEVEPAGDWELKNTYPNYTCGADGFMCNYKDGNYHVEMKRKDFLRADVERNTANIEYIALMADVEIAE